MHTTCPKLEATQLLLAKKRLLQVNLVRIILASALLTGCVTPKTATQNTPAGVNKPAIKQVPTQAPSKIPSQIPGQTSNQTSSQPNAQTNRPPNESTASTQPSDNNANNSNTSKPGGYYLDDGPGDNPPKDIDSIPDATPKKEPLLERSNKPYKALGSTYIPMTSYQPYKTTGVASWYGKRYHGKKTSSGEVYDMYSMTAAHPTLPLPSYVKVTNPANNRSVIVRVNDRGPFKSNRVIDLSYAAAYKLRFSKIGSSLVEVQAIDANNFVADSRLKSSLAPANSNHTENSSNTATLETVADTTVKSSQEPSENQNNSQLSYFVQAGAFKQATNANALLQKIQGLNISQNAAINSVYNNGLYRLKLGPFESKQQADLVASRIRSQLNTAAVTTLQ